MAADNGNACHAQSQDHTLRTYDQSCHAVDADLEHVKAV